MAATLALDGELSIYRAAELKPVVLQALAKADAGLEIDLSAVTEFDTAGLQLLMLAKQQAAALQRELHLVGHSPPVLEVFELLNVAAFFGDPLIVAAPAAGGRHGS